jgi:hypothetical protein
MDRTSVNWYAVCRRNVHMNEMVIYAGYAFGVFCAALAMETLKALIWVSIFMAFYKRLLR